MSMKLVLAAIIALALCVSAVAERVELGTIPDDVQATVLESNENRTVVRFDVGAFEQGDEKHRAHDNRDHRPDLADKSGQEHQR